MSVFIQHITSNMKLGCNVELGPKVVIVGPNSMGKSTVIQSAELATSGLVSDVEGREQVRLPSAIARLFPNVGIPSVTVELSDGTTYSWSVERKKDGSLKTVSHDCPMAVRWPVQEIRAVLNGDGTAIASWLEKRVLGDGPLSAVLKQLPPEVVSDVKRLASGKSSADFLGLSKAAKDEARRLRTEATRSEKTVEQMVVGVPAPLSGVDRAELERRLSVLAGPQAGMSPEEHVALQARVEALVGQYQTAETSLGQLEQPSVDVSSAFQKIETALRLAQEHEDTFGVDDCWVCGLGTASHVADQRERLTSARGRLGPAALAAAERLELERKLMTLANELRGLVPKLKAAVIRADASAESNDLRSKLASDDAAKRTWQNATAVRLEVAQQRARADHLTTAGKALASAGKDLLEQKKLAYETEVSRFLPSGERLVVDLESSRVGLEDASGLLRTALSGAEESRVLLALASAEATDGPTVLATQDRAWDGATLARVMDALTEAPVQVLLMSTVEPELVPKGWQILRVGGAS